MKVTAEAANVANDESLDSKRLEPCCGWGGLEVPAVEFIIDVVVDGVLDEVDVLVEMDVLTTLWLAATTPVAEAPAPEEALGGVSPNKRGLNRVSHRGHVMKAALGS